MLLFEGECGLVLGNVGKMLLFEDDEKKNSDFFVIFITNMNSKSSNEGVKLFYQISRCL